MVDLVITDYNMPEMDGRGTTEYIEHKAGRRQYRS